MSETIRALAYFGALISIVIACFLAFGLLYAIREGFHKLKWRHKYKHRFDKPPTAACYCRDCKKHGDEDETQRCYKFDGWHTSDDWFCWDAEPREESQERKEIKR